MEFQVNAKVRLVFNEHSDELRNKKIGQHVQSFMENERLEDFYAWNVRAKKETAGISRGFPATS